MKEGHSTTNPGRRFSKSGLKIGFALCILWAFSSCDHGLELPPPVKPGFGGRIAYKGNWPPPDSIKLLAVVAFKHFPPTNIVADVLSGEAVFDTTLKRKVEFQDYSFSTEPGTFEYIVVAQQYGPDIFSNWRVVGLYTDDPEKIRPKSVVITKETFVPTVNITVDFDHLPPQVLVKRTPR
ncbi:MAG: hypothetical protein AABZ61_06830 [Bacteroidota bacterium]|mgnify:CR=1 FL=1